MWQRVVDFYQSVNNTEALDLFLNNIGIEQTLSNANTRLSRVNNVITVDDSVRD